MTMFGTRALRRGLEMTALRHKVDVLDAELRTCRIELVAGYVEKCAAIQECDDLRRHNAELEEMLSIETERFLGRVFGPATWTERQRQHPSNGGPS